MKDVLTKAQQEVLQVLAEHRGPLRFGDWAKLVTQQLGVSTALVQKTRSRAAEHNLIAQTGNDGWELTSFGRQ
jgi:Mn-dependent DtxR family transcriptional regulator